MSALHCSPHVTPDTVTVQQWIITWSRVQGRVCWALRRTGAGARLCPLRSEPSVGSQPGPRQERETDGVTEAEDSDKREKREERGERPGASTHGERNIVW